MQHWIKKFALAWRGIREGIDGQTSFYVHFPMAIAVWVAAAFLRCEFWQWVALSLCIAMVLSLELMNSAIEYLARGLCREHNEEVGRALDIASGAVLLASVFAAAIGAAILIARAIAVYVT